MPFNTGISAGTRQIVTVRFDVAANAPGGQTPLTFSDMPVIREVSDVNANVLQSNFQDGAINILSPTSANASLSGKVRDAKGNGLAQVRVVLNAPNGQTRAAVTNSFGNYRFDGVETGETYILTVSSRKYFFADPTQIVNVQDTLEDIDFVGEN